LFETRSNLAHSHPLDLYEINNYGTNDNLLLRKNRQKGDRDLKTILMWNDAYGVRTYDIGWGREPFYKKVQRLDASAIFCAQQFSAALQITGNRLFSS
jgi:hypothetical protein